MRTYSSLSLILILLISLISCDNTTRHERQSRVDRLPYYSEATFTPNWHHNNSAELAFFHKISPFSLTNQDGNTVTQKDLRGKIYVADFFFTSCTGICPKMTQNMGLLQEAFLEDDEVLLLSHSVTPTQDSVSVLKAYAEHKGVLSDKWHLLTGDRAQIYKLGREDYFVEEDLGLKKGPDAFLHTENFVLVDKNGFIRGIYNGINKSSIEQLIADITLLKSQV